MDKSELRILVVDDEVSLAEIFLLIFKEEGYQVDYAGNGVNALLRLGERRYDLLLSDLYMPEMDGAKLIHQCRQLYPEMRVILLSGGGKDLVAVHASNTALFQGEEIDVDLFLKKPVDIVEILNHVEQLLLD